MTSKINKVDVNVEALPVVSEFLNDGNGGVKCEEVREFESPMFGKIRVAGTSEEPLFCLLDVCNALGYKNSRDALRKHVEEEDVAKCDTPTSGGLQSMTYVTESGLYSLIFGSKVDGAKAFKKWVTSEVLPTIRKTGGYGIPQTFSEALLLASKQAKQIEMQQLALAQKQAENDKLVADNEQQKAEIKVYKPKAAYFDMIMANPSCSKVTSIAQDYGMSPQAFNDLLHELGIQYKVDKQWILYQKYKGKGYVHSEPVTITHHDGHQTVQYLTVWKQKGRLFLYGLLKEKGILPMIERDEKSEAHGK